jgi:hypothetical protein
MIKPATGKMSTQRIHKIFSVPVAEDWIILMMANISNTKMSKPMIEYIFKPSLKVVEELYLVTFDLGLKIRSDSSTSHLALLKGC